MRLYCFYIKNFNKSLTCNLETNYNDINAVYIYTSEVYTAKFVTYYSVANPVFIGAGSSDESTENDDQEITSLQSQVYVLTGMLAVIFAFGALFSIIFLGRKYGIFAKISAFMNGLHENLRPRRGDIPMTIVDQPVHQETCFNDSGVQEHADGAEVDDTKDDTVVEATIMIEDGNEEQAEQLAVGSVATEPAQNLSGPKIDGK